MDMEKIREQLMRIDALLYAYDVAYLDIDENDFEMRDRRAHAFYGICDAVKALEVKIQEVQESPLVELC